MKDMHDSALLLNKGDMGKYKIETHFPIMLLFIFSYIYFIYLCFFFNYSFKIYSTELFSFLPSLVWLSC